ncbi:MAG: transporter [Devosia sp.]|uniref:MDR family MFS transporter n=1 Tax=Devosia sp. TaxID=1871048 RepID=UPI00262B9602|nr:MDR family MFS transporter [Devosia sp.]MDB5542038.1 transporter [Devosia sp.]
MTSETVNDVPSDSAGFAPVASPSDISNAARNRLVIALLLVSTFVVFLNETIMSVAIQPLMTDLGVTASAAQWLTTAFLLTMAVVIPITGFLLQRINTRPIYMLAMSIFSAGTLICAVSPGLELLVFGRVIQDTGTAIMKPLLMTTVMTLVPPESRGKTMGNISIVMSVAPAIGPTIGGFILTHFEWRFMFILVLPIALAALALGAWRMKNVSTPRSTPLDFISVILSALAFGGIVYGLSGFGEAASAGAHGMSPWIPLGVGLVTMVLFVLRQLSLQKEDKALLDLRTFAIRNYTLSVTMMAIAMMALFGVIILLPLFLQNVLKLDPLQIGMMLLPGSLAMGLLGPVVGRLYDKWGTTRLLVPGSILVSAVLWGLTLVDQNTSVWVILAGHVTLCIGLAIMFTPLFTASLSSLPMQLYSHGSAILGSVQQVAGAAGVALFVALMTIQTAALTASGTEPVTALAAGIRTGFLCGAVISLFAVVAAFFVKKPPANPEMAGMGH